MTKPLIKLIKLNNLQYNPNRDPQAYRRCANEPFRIQVLLDGAGEAKCALTDQRGQVLDQKTVILPGTYTHEVSFATPGVRLVTLSVEGNGQRVSQDLRLDVREGATRPADSAVPGAKRPEQMFVVQKSGPVPVGAPDGSQTFLNAVVLLDTTLSANRLLDRLNVANPGTSTQLMSAGRTSHALGGLPMGKACLPTGEVAGYQNMWVIDSSLIPGSLAAVPPALTVTALADRCVMLAKDKILQDRQQP